MFSCFMPGTNIRGTKLCTKFGTVDGVNHSFRNVDRTVNSDVCFARGKFTSGQVVKRRGMEMTRDTRFQKASHYR